MVGRYTAIRFPMSNPYRFTANLAYMALLFTNPRRVITHLLQEPSHLYGIVPFVLYLLVGEAGNLGAALQGYSLQDSANPFPGVLPFDSYSAKLALFPLLSVIDLGIFAGVIYGLSQLRWCRGISAAKCTTFLMFLSSIGILLLICEAPWMPAMLRWAAPPIGGLIAVLYLAAFIQRLAQLSWTRSLLVSFLALAVYFAFRAATMR